MQESIYSACLSPSGNTFGYSTLSTLRLFHIDYNPTTSKQPVLSKLKLIDASSEDVTGNYIADETPLQLQFLQEDTMILVSACGKISFLKIDLDSRTANVVKVADIDFSENVGLGVGIVSVAIDGKHLCLSCDGNLSIYSVNNNLDIVKGSSIPSHSAKPTSVSFHPTKTFVLITYADHLVQVFDYKSGRILLYQRVKKKVDDLYPFIGAEWSSDGHSAVLYQVDSLQLLEMEPEEVPKKKTKRTDQNDDKFIFAVKSCAKHKYIAFAGYFNDGNEIVAVDVNPNGLLERLPPSFVKKRFGA
jgi:WD40 repeat protein